MSARPKRSSAGTNCAASCRGRPRTLPPSSKLCSKLFTLFLGLCGALSACAEENYELGAVPDLGTPQELRESVNFPSKVNTELLAPTEGTAHGAAVPTGAPLPQGDPAAQGEQAGPSAPGVNAAAVSPQSLLQNSKEVLQCYHVTGEYTFLIKVSCGSMMQLEQLILQFQKLGSTCTQIILSTPVDHGPLEALQL